MLNYVPFVTFVLTGFWSSHFVVVWEEKKESGEELAIAACTCSEENYITAGNSDYCQSWTCEGVGVKKCPQGNTANCGSYISIGLDSGYYTQCCYQECDDDNNCHSVVDNKKVHNEFQDCLCTNTVVDTDVTNGITTYCDAWQCIDYQAKTRESTNYGYYEYELHTCNKRNATYGFCEDWEWQTDDYYSWENTACDCVLSINSTDGLTTCGEFECKEKGATKTFPEFGWVGFGIGFGLILLAVLYNVDEDEAFAFGPLYFFGWVLAFIALVFVVPCLMGGLPSLALVIIIVFSLFFFFVYANADIRQGEEFHRKMRKLNSYLFGCCGCFCPYNDKLDKPPVFVPEEVEMPPKTGSSTYEPVGSDYSVTSYPQAGETTTGAPSYQLYPASPTLYTPAVPTTECYTQSSYGEPPPPSYTMTAQSDDTRV